MNKILKTTLATTFAAACLAGASMTFAADNGGKNGDNGNNANTNSQDNGDNKCADDANATDAGANCTTQPNAEQQ